MRGARHFCVLLPALVALASCAAQPTPGQRAAPDVPRAAEAGAPKSVTIGIQREPTTVNQVLAGSPAGGVESFRRVVQNYLAVANDQLVPVPQLAVEQISHEAGTWRVHPDGTMDTLWKLHPNVTWHDGAPFSAADLLFAFTVYKDPQIPTRDGGVLALMQSAAAPDPLTFVVHWSSPFVQANEAIGLEPLPRHLLEELYLSDKDSFANSPRFTVDFVGLGPYRLARWEPGVQTELVRFTEYYRGRPPLDTVTIRFLADENTMVANILSGAVDVLLPTGVGLEAAMEVKRRWEGTGNQVLPVMADRLRFVEPQHRGEFARPAEGVTNPMVRQALYMAVERPALADVATLGLSTIADSWFSPTHELRTQVEDAIPQYPYTPRRAQELLAQAGWTRSGDGTLVHGRTGERFELELMGTPGRGVDKEQNVLADGWKSIGVQTQQVVLPAAIASDRERNATFPGLRLSGAYSLNLYTDRLRTTTVATQANRWSGMNQGGYRDPQADALFERVATTIPLTERIVLHRELLQKAFTDVVIMPLYWEVEPVLVVQGVRNVKGRGPWNMHEWDKA